jgi:hypothetical protein
LLYFLLHIAPGRKRWELELRVVVLNSHLLVQNLQKVAKTHDW